MGNTINVDTGVWSRRDSGVGAGVDSFYEYLLKAYLAFGDEAYLTMFSEAYAAAQAQMALSPEVNGVSWPVDVHMTSGRVLHTYVSALSAFWPGLQALVGQTQEAATLHANWMAAWERFKWTPDMFHLYLQQQHPTMVGYPLRPEIIESAFLLYATTGDGAFVGAGQAIQERLQQTAKGKCGYASVGDVATGRLEDTMESFFLSETVKYLYLLFANATAVVDHFVLSTEGHLLPVFPGGKREYAAETAATEAWKLGSVGVNATAVEAKLRDNCSALCDSDTRSGRKAATASLRSALPWLPLDPGAVRLLRQRRCKACRTVTRAVAAATVRADLMWRSAADSPMVADKPQAAPAHWALSRQPAGVRPRQFLCMLTPSGRRKLGCSVFSEVPYESLTSQAVQALPHNALFLQVTDSSALPPPSAETWAQALVEVELESWNAAGRAGLPAMLAEFGPDLLPGCNASDPAAVAAARAAWDEELERRKKFEFEHEEEDDDDREESEEEVRRRIAALARAGEQCGTGAGASASTGSGNECHSGNNNGGDRGTHGSSCSCSADSGASSGCGCGDKKDPSLGPEGSAGSQNPDDDDEYLDPDEDSGDSQQQQGSHQGGEGVADGELLDAAAVCDAQGVVVMVQPRDACTQLKNPERLHGAVAVIHRGNCTFQSKVLAAQNAGAVGVVIVDSMPKGGLSSMGGDANAAVPVIPAVLVRAREQAVLEATAEAGGKVRVWRPPLARRVQLGEVLMKESVNVTSGRDGQGATCSAVDASMPGSNGTCPVTGPREEPQGQLTVEMVLPPNSNSWVMHQIYQRDMDLTPAFNQLADYLGATTGD